MAIAIMVWGEISQNTVAYTSLFVYGNVITKSPEKKEKGSVRCRKINNKNMLTWY